MKHLTEEEALNDPEMKIIILLSGYVCELRDGKDYEKTTIELAERISRIFSAAKDERIAELEEALRGVMNILYNDKRGGVYSGFRHLMEPEEISTIEKAKSLLP